MDLEGNDDCLNGDNDDADDDDDDNDDCSEDDLLEELVHAGRLALPLIFLLQDHNNFKDICFFIVVNCMLIAFLQIKQLFLSSIFLRLY